MSNLNHFNVVNRETKEVVNSFSDTRETLSLTKRTELWILQSQDEETDLEVQMWEGEKMTVLVESLLMDRLINSEV